MNAWLLFGVGVLLEVFGTTCMKLSHGFHRPWPSLLMFVFYGMSLTTLAVALRDIDIGLAYTIWSAVGTVMIVTIGFVWFGEPATIARLFWLAVILCGIIGLRRASLPVQP